MEDFVAYPSRRRGVLLVLGSMAFVAIGLLMGGAFGPLPESRFYHPLVIPALGWFSVMFFGLCGIGWAKRLFGGREQLRIGSAGIHSAQWSGQTIPWSEIVDVTIWTSGAQKAIVLHLRDAARFPGRGLAKVLASANRKMTGGDISISLVGTDRSFDEAMSAIARFAPSDAPQPLDPPQSLKSVRTAL